jgi:hypothetical protein
VTNLLFDQCDFFFQVIAFDELKTDYKNPIDQCNSLNPVSCIKSCWSVQRLILLKFRRVKTNRVRWCYIGRCCFENFMLCPVAIHKFSQTILYGHEVTFALFMPSLYFHTRIIS